MPKNTPKPKSNDDSARREAAAYAAPHVCTGCASHDPAEAGEATALSSTKPRVDRWEDTQHQGSRNGTDIDHIVIHYTTSRNVEGTISHFKHGTPETSAHYLIGRDGALVQMVRDGDRAWHAGNGPMNARSIGIEHAAAVGDRITPQQAAVSAALIGWLMREYEIDREHVIPHICVPRNTNCCGDLFADFGGGVDATPQAQRNALHAWMASMGL